MKKKLMSLFVAGAMCISMVACGGNAEDGAGENPAGEEPSEAAGDEEPGEAAGDEEPGETSSGEGEIRFAVIAPMTGNDANSGFQQVNGVQVAVDEINASGGINGKMLAFDTYDDQLIPEQTVICAEKIAANADDYLFTVTTISSGCTQSMNPILEEVDMPVIGYVNAMSLTEQGFKNFIRIPYTDRTNVDDLVRVCVEERGCAKPAILYSSSDVDTSRCELAKQYLGEKGIEAAVISQFQPDTDKDFSSFITKFKDEGCDSIFVFGEYGSVGLFLKQKQNLQFDVPVFATSGAANINVIGIAGGSACEDLVTSCGFFAGSPHVQDFVTAYKEISGGEEPGEPAAGGYDMLMVMADALRNGADGLEGIELVDWMKENTHVEDGLLCGPVDFNEVGDNEIAEMVLLTVKDDAFALYE